MFSSCFSAAKTYKDEEIHTNTSGFKTLHLTRSLKQHSLQVMLFYKENAEDELSHSLGGVTIENLANFNLNSFLPLRETGCTVIKMS